ncbi:MAG: DUF4372 domain-containing protein [Alphaproteobacteria bacterium]|nr:DUF4372 domain-containing protein [Alphaproteobacteria bacterium]
MHHKDMLFSQIIKYIPRHRFDTIVEQHGGDRRVRKLSCWTQFRECLNNCVTDSKLSRKLLCWLYLCGDF